MGEIGVCDWLKPGTYESDLDVGEWATLVDCSADCYTLLYVIAIKVNQQSTVAIY